MAIAGSGYLIVVAALAFGLFEARKSARDTFSTAGAHQAWDAWRKDTQSPDSSKLPVRRSVPRSTEPPTLVLLRDHFGVCVAAILTLSTILYWTLAFFVRGIVTGPKFAIEYTLDGTRRVR